MKCYITHTIDYFDKINYDDPEFIARPAKMLGSAIIDGRYNGVSDGQAGLLHGQYDDPNSLSVDPLCDMSTDVFSLRTGNNVVSPGDAPSTPVSE